MKSPFRSGRSLAACAIAVALAGCGGHDDDDTPAATSQVPTSASQSVTGFIQYLRELVVSSADLLEPVDTTAVTPPLDETAEPTQVD